MTSLRDLAGRSVRPMLIIGLILALAQQFVGVNTVRRVGLFLGLLVLAVYFSSATVQRDAGHLALTGLLISEILPVGLRSVAMSVCRQGVSYLNTGLALAALVFFAAKVPQMRGRSLKGVQAELAGDH